MPHRDCDDADIKNSFYGLSIFLIVAVCIIQYGTNDRTLKKGQINKDHNQQTVPQNYDESSGDKEKTSDQLSPEDSKIRLALIVNLMDTNRDNFVTHSELKTWIQRTQLKSYEEVDKHWQDHVPSNKDSLAWDDYNTTIYRFLDHLDLKGENGYLHCEALKRDKRRWQAADYNHDGILSKHEFGTCLRPEVAEHTRKILIIEAIEDIDKDKDGKVSLEEYISRLYQGGKDEEPDWVRQEREQFYWKRDRNGDGFMDPDEALAWILTQIFYDAENEAWHLLSESDSDLDKKLTRKEILNKHNLFVASPATGFGKVIRHVLDEL